MKFSSGFAGREREIVTLFTSAFTASEGAREGALIGDLVGNLLSGTADEDLFVFTAVEAERIGEKITGGIVFSRLTYPQDDRTVFVLGPVAVAADRQGEGIGQRLLNHGLTALGNAGIDIVATYGDPAYYAKVGFAPVAEDFAQAPFRLSHPEGWLAQSLTEQELTPLKGPARCVEAFNDPAFW